jgi:hypothetical protein
LSFDRQERLAGHKLTGHCLKVQNFAMGEFQVHGERFKALRRSSIGLSTV